MGFAVAEPATGKRRKSMRGRTWIVLAAAGALVAGGCEKKSGAAAAPPDTAPAAEPAASNAAQAYRAVHDALGSPLLDAVKNGANADAMLAQHGADIERLVEATR